MLRFPGSGAAGNADVAVEDLPGCGKLVRCGKRKARAPENANYTKAGKLLKKPLAG
jgi:hypothetical protein